MISPAISLVRSCSRPVFGLARRGNVPRHHLPQFLRTQFAPSSAYFAWADGKGERWAWTPKYGSSP
jgi:hypothetical protein